MMMNASESELESLYVSACITKNLIEAKQNKQTLTKVSKDFVTYFIWLGTILGNSKHVLRNVTINH